MDVGEPLIKRLSHSAAATWATYAGTDDEQRDDGGGLGEAEGAIATRTPVAIFTCVGIGTSWSQC